MSNIVMYIYIYIHAYIYAFPTSRFSYLVSRFPFPARNKKRIRVSFLVSHFLAVSRKQETRNNNQKNKKRETPIKGITQSKNTN